MRIRQIELVSAIFKHLDKQGVKHMAPRRTNAVIAAANLIVEAFDKELVMATPGMGLGPWTHCDDTGLSPMYMAFVLAPVAGQGEARRPQGWAEHPHPHDPDDFGRCHRLLLAVPELRPHVQVMAKGHGPAWAAFAPAWDELERLYLEESPNGRCTRLYARMQELLA